MDEEKCSICLCSKQLPVTFNPCKHSVCTGCYRGLYNSNTHTNCPECRAAIITLDNVPPDVPNISPRLTASEQREAQAHFDEEYEREIERYRWRKGLEDAKQFIPLFTIIFGSLALVQAAQMGYFAMFCFVLFCVTHFLDHQFRISVRGGGGNALVAPRRRFANENIREAVYERRDEYYNEIME